MGVVTGGCLCGTIGYEVDEPIGPIGNCHCGTCRKSHSAAFATTARVPRSAFRWTRGESEKRAFESSPGKKRFFCPNCGSQLLAAWDHQDEVILRIGSLFDDPGGKPLIDIWTAEKATWFEPGVELPSFPGGRPSRKVDD